MNNHRYNKAVELLKHKCIDNIGCEEGVFNYCFYCIQKPCDLYNNFSMSNSWRVSMKNNKCPNCKEYELQFNKKLGIFICGCCEIQITLEDYNGLVEKKNGKLGKEDITKYIT